MRTAVVVCRVGVEQPAPLGRRADGITPVDDVRPIRFEVGGIRKDAADANDDGRLDVSDAIASLAYQFLGNVEIAAPGPLICGPDPSSDSLLCESFPPCE